MVKHLKNWGLDEQEVKKIADEELKRKGLREVELSLVFVGKKKARGLNQRYRKMDYVPEVLAFPMDNEILGDIVVCIDKLKSEKQLREWIRHGIVNLLQ